MDENLKVKAKFKGTSRRFEISCNSTWPQLLVQLRQLFVIRDEFLIKYCDDEHELVSISSQEELSEAIRLCKKTSKLLYLHLEDPFSQHTSDQTLLELEQKKAQDIKTNKSSSCYGDLASAMADELSALNSRLEKSATLQSSKKQNVGQQKEENKQQAKKDDSHSHYSDLAAAMAPELSALNERMSKPAKKEKETAKAAENQQLAKVVKNEKKSKNKQGSCYSDLAAAMAPELSALNERMPKPAQKEKETAKAAENQQLSKVVKNEKQTDKKSKNKQGSCYSDLADAMAPEFSALNTRMSMEAQKDKEVPKTAEESQGATSEVKAHTPPLPEPSKSCYINLEEIMTQSKQVDDIPVNTFVNDEQHELQRPDMGASRGWFGQFEEQQASAFANKSKASKKKKKKQNHYSELAEAMSSELSKLTVKDPGETSQSTNNDKVDSIDDKKVKEPVLMQVLPPTAADTSDCKRQLDGQSQNKPKRSKKHGKKLGCYAQLAEDMSPMFAAMNKRLEEQHKKETLIQVASRDISIEREVPLLSSSPESSSSEPFVFVTNNEEPLSIEAESIEIVDCQSPGSPSCDAVPDGTGATSSVERGEQDNTESNLITFDNENNMLRSPAKSSEDVKEMVKEILKESMPTIISETVQRLQTPNTKLPATPCNTPQENATPPGIAVHKGITCDYCCVEVQGIRYKCGNCKDFDLCETCEEMPGIHNIEHVFVKLRYPAPGIGRRHGEMVPIFKKSVYKKNCEKRQKEKELRRAAKEAARERKRAMKEQKHALKAKEKERKKKEKAKKVEQTKERPETERNEVSHVYDRLRAEFVCDANYPDGSIVLPGQKFLKSWVINNAGDIAWNQWITLECIEGSIMGFPVAVPFLKPGAQDEVSVEFVAPEVPGTYSSKWQLSYGLHTFGPYLWCEIHVPERKGAILCDQYSLVDTAFKTAAGPDVKRVHEPLLQTAVDDGSSSEYLSSEETPESGLSCSPEAKKESSLMSNGLRQDLEWDAGCMHDVEIANISTDNMEPLRQRRNTDNWSFSEDSDGEESDSSLDEFTVMIPTCFDPDAPLTANPFPVIVTDFKPYKISGSFSSPFLNSLESADPGFQPDDSGPSSLPNIRTVSTDEEKFSDDTNLTTDKPDSTPTEGKITRESEQQVETPSGRVSTRDLPEEPVAIETPISKQPSVSQRDIPLVTQPTTVTEPRRSRTDECETKDPNNLVSEVLNTAIDAVAMAGRAAFATVDNFINGTPEATAVYKPEENCEVKVNRRGPGSEFDAPPPPPLVWPVSRQPSTAMEQLIEMGFCDRRLNERLLRKHKDDIRATIEELLGHTENEWSGQRH